MSKKREIKFGKIFYQRNVDLGIDPECHECTSHAHDVNGYSQLYREGKYWLLHRWVYIQATNESPEVVMHLCDNPRCINLNHLKGGTVQENMRDMVNKGRHVDNSGGKFGASKLTELDVKFIRVWIELGYTQRSVAKVFKISESHTSRINSKDCWGKY